jgi:hypothetical protein
LETDLPIARANVVEGLAALGRHQLAVDHGPHWKFNGARAIEIFLKRHNRSSHHD